VLPQKAVIDIARILGDDQKAFIVGGQAVNLWAEYYSLRAEDLSYYRPFTSKDIDYYGQRDVAQKLATGLGGSLILPDPDDTTFQTAMVTAKVGGITVGIDFLSHVLGVQRGLEDGVVDLIIPYEFEGEQGEVGVRLMHPFHCYQSRIANLIKLGRSDETAKRQAEAAPIVLREFISEALEDGDQRAAIDTLKAVFGYLKADIYGKHAHKHTSLDPIDILRKFLKNENLDVRYRERSLTKMVTELEKRRSILRRCATVIQKRLLGIT